MADIDPKKVKWDAPQIDPAKVKWDGDSSQKVTWADATRPEVDWRNVAMGGLKAASDIGATLLRPVDAIYDKISGKTTPSLSNLVTGQVPRSTNEERRQQLADFFKQNANPDSYSFKGGELGGDIAGTAGVGGALGKIPAIAQYAPKLAAALESGGFRLNAPAATTAAGKLGDMAIRVAGGAAVGGASAGLINPSDAAAGAAIGGALPVVAKAAGAAGRAIANEVSPEVQALYKRAKELGIDVPADRIVNSKPMNAVAASLNYVPLSGRTGTEERMLSQVNRAVSRTFGQDSDNITAALRKADLDLGMKFERTLQNNVVKADQQLLDDLVQHLDTASKELGKDGARIIGNQIDEIIAKVGKSGDLDGQAAYNIKKALDRIGNRNAPEAYYARELKKSLMSALDRSLGPVEAAKFAKVRQQYGSMLDIENIAQNGAEGGVSIARLGNMKNINNPELQEIADITAQFIRTRESPHGAAQRIALGTLGAGVAGATGTLPVLAGGIAAGRVANTALNSNMLKNALINRQAVGNRVNQIAEDPILRALTYRAATSTNP